MKPANPCTITINCGSSGIKFALFEVGALFRQILERIGLSEATLRVKGVNQTNDFSRLVIGPDHTAVVVVLMDWIDKQRGRDALTAVGHCVVQGGPNYYKPQRITAEMLEDLHRLDPFDLEHLQVEILLTEGFHRRFPDLPQVACFDTAFHNDLPRIARLLQIPRRYEAQGVRCYGFHGLPYEFLIGELSRLGDTSVTTGRVILMQDAVDRLPHLGSKGAYMKQQMQDKIIEHKNYIAKYGQDLPKIRNWKWSNPNE
ncbi:MAG: phosphoketolase family protein [Nitrososphaerales archaeon]